MSGGAMATHASAGTPSARAISAIQAPKDQPATLTSSMPSRDFIHSKAAPTSAGSSMPSVKSPVLAPTPAKLNRITANPAATPLRSMTCSRPTSISPPPAGCGWQSSIPCAGPLLSGSARHASSSAAPEGLSDVKVNRSVTCSLWLDLELHLDQLERARVHAEPAEDTPVFVQGELSAGRLYLESARLAHGGAGAARDAERLLQLDVGYRVFDSDALVLEVLDPGLDLLTLALELHQHAADLALVDLRPQYVRDDVVLPDHQGDHRALDDLRRERQDKPLLRHLDPLLFTYLEGQRSALRRQRLHRNRQLELRLRDPGFQDPGDLARNLVARERRGRHLLAVDIDGAAPQLPVADASHRVPRPRLLAVIEDGGHDVGIRDTGVLRHLFVQYRNRDAHAHVQAHTVPVEPRTADEPGVHLLEVPDEREARGRAHRGPSR